MKKQYEENEEMNFLTECLDDIIEEVESMDAIPDDPELDTKPKRRGRPKGSKNKPKTNLTENNVTKKKKRKSAVEEKGSNVVKADDLDELNKILDKDTEDLQNQMTDHHNKDEESVVMYGLAKMSKEIRSSTAVIDKKQLRFLVDSFYQTQKFRIAIQAQQRSIDQDKDGEGNKETVMNWLLNNVANQELEIKKALEAFTDHNMVCKWMKANVGLGPLISAMLYAYFDITGVEHVGNFWNYAGLNNNNNGWLGKTLAEKVVTSAIKSRDSIMKSKVSLFKFSEKDNETMEKIFDKYYGIEDRGYTVLEKIPRPIYDKLCEEFDKDEDRMIEFIAFVSNKSIVTHKTINRVVYELNNTKKGNTSYIRKTANIVKCAVITKESDPNFGKITITSLKNGLSKPPYNLDLHITCWKLGEMFKFNSKRSNSLYGRIYLERKEYEEAKNERLEYKDQAEAILASDSAPGKNTVAYKYLIQGKLSPSHIVMRAKRYAVKLFISHLFEAMYLEEHGYYPKETYVIAHLGHSDYIEPEVPFEKYIKFDPDARKGKNVD